MEINTNILNEMGLIQKFGDFLSQGQGTSLEEFFDSPAGKDYKSAYEQKLQTLGDTKATTENGLPQTEQQNKDEIKIEYGSSKSSADPSNNEGWEELKKINENSSIEKKEPNNYRLVTTGENGLPRDPTDAELKAFIGGLPPKAKIKLSDDLSPQFKAMIIKELGEDVAANRIVNIDKVNNDPEVNKKLEEIKLQDTVNASTVQTGKSDHTDNKEGNNDEPEGDIIDTITGEKKEPKNETPKGLKITREQELQDNTPKDGKSPKVIYNEKDLPKSAKEAYDAWTPKKGAKTVNAFLVASEGRGYKALVSDIKENGPHSRWASFKMAIKQNNIAKKEYKMTEGFVQDLQFLGAVDSGLPRDKLKDENQLKERITELEKSHPNMFGKYRRMFEEDMLKNLPKELHIGNKKNYFNKSYEDRTEIIKRYMAIKLTAPKTGYLTSEENKTVSQKGLWKKYKNIRAEEKPLRKDKRKAKWKNRLETVTNVAKATGKGVVNVVTWPARISWKGIKKIPQIPEAIKKARIKKLENKISKKIDGKTIDKLSKRRIKQILILQGRLNMRKDGKKVGIGDLAKIRNDVRGESDEARKADIERIIAQRTQQNR